MKSSAKKILFFICLLFITSLLDAQLFEGLPKVVNYYNPDKPYTVEQVWDINQTQDGLLYFASGQYFLEFDGINFFSIFEDFNAYFLSFDIEDDNRQFFIGQKNTLSRSVFKNNIYDIEDIDIPVTINYCWETIIEDSAIYYFINNTDVVCYNKQNIGLIKRPSNFEIDRGFKVSDKIFAVSVNGLAEIIDGQLNLLSFKNDKYFREDIRVFLNFDDDNYLIATKKNNLYLMNKYDFSFDVFENELGDILNNAEIYHGSVLDDTTFVISTLRKGVFFISKSGKLLGHFDQSNGLVSNAVYVSFVDEYKNVWLGTGKGVSQILWGSPIKYVDRRSDLNSGVMTFNFFNENLIVSTYNGLLASVFNEDEGNFSLKNIDSTVLYASNIVKPREFQSDYFIASAYDKFTIIDQKLKLVIDQKLNIQPVKLYESPVKSNRFFLGTKRGFSVFNLKITSDSVRFKLEKEFFNLSFNIDNLFFDDKNNLWLTHSNSVFLIDFNEDEDLDNYNRYFYDQKNGLPDAMVTSVFMLSDTFYFSTNDGIYKIDDISKSPSEYKFSKSNNSFFNSIVNSIVAFIETDNFYFFNDKTAIYRCSKDFKNIDKIPVNLLFETYYSKMMLNNGNLWLNSKDNILVIDTSGFNSNNKYKYDIRLKKIKINHNSYFPYTSDSIFTISNNNYVLNNDVYKDTSVITLDFFSPFFDTPQNTKYFFQIEGITNGWEELQSNSLVLRNLEPSNYLVQVKAINYYGEESNELKIYFGVKGDFFNSKLARLLYVVLIAIVVYILIFVFNKKNRNKNKTLEDVVLKRTVLLEEQKEELSVQSKELKEQKKLLEREKERLQIALIELKQLSLVAQKTNNSVLIVEQNGKFEWWNIGFTDLFSYKIEKYSNLPLKKAHQKIRPDIFREIKGYTLDKGTINYITHEVFDNNEEIWYQTTISPVTMDEIDYFKFVVIDYNITTIKSNENQIQTLQEANQLIKNRLNKAIAELRLKQEYFSKIEHFDKNNLEYAKLLKQVIIVDNNIQLKNLQYFVLDVPQNELSGDFSWNRQISDNEILLILGDTTGHKIRGAINSVIAVSYLHDLLLKDSNLSNEQLLKLLDKKLFEVFNANNKLKGKDHLNIALLKFYIKEKQLMFTSSRIPLFLIRTETQDMFYKYDGDRFNVGVNSNKSLTTHKIPVKDTDRIYLSTDGWANQFGKFGLKKYSNSKIREFLLSIQDEEIYKHKDLIYSEIVNWKGSFEQTDDILIFCAEIKLLTYESL